MKCTNCAITKPTGEARQSDPQWWHLNNHYGLTGLFCPDCYERVSHDPYGVPRHPAEYQQIKTRQHQGETP